MDQYLNFAIRLAITDSYDSRPAIIPASAFDAPHYDHALDNIVQALHRIPDIAVPHACRGHYRRERAGGILPGVLEVRMSETIAAKFWDSAPAWIESHFDVTGITITLSSNPARVRFEFPAMPGDTTGLWPAVKSAIISVYASCSLMNSETADSPTLVSNASYKPAGARILAFRPRISEHIRHEA